MNKFTSFAVLKNNFLCIFAFFTYFDFIAILWKSIQQLTMDLLQYFHSTVNRVFVAIFGSDRNSELRDSEKSGQNSKSNHFHHISQSCQLNLHHLSIFHPISQKLNKQAWNKTWLISLIHTIPTRKFNSNEKSMKSGNTRLKPSKRSTRLYTELWMNQLNWHINVQSTPISCCDCVFNIWSACIWPHISHWYLIDFHNLFDLSFVYTCKIIFLSTQIASCNSKYCNKVNISLANKLMIAPTRIYLIVKLNRAKF